MNTIVNCQQIEDFVNQRIIIFGAGRVGYATASFFRGKGVPESDVSIVVSQLYGNPDNILGYRVFSFDDDSVDWNGAVVIIALMNNGINEVIEKLEEKTEHLFQLSTEVSLELRHMVGDYEYEISCLTEKNRLLNIENMELLQRLNRTLPQKRLGYVVVNILDHCNLNCKGCDHFSPIAEPRFISKDIVVKDLLRLSEVMTSGVDRIGIMGGEPLMHPELVEIIKGARKCFPDSRIQIDTNGLLLCNQSDCFWEAVKENDIEIVQTKYPIDLDFERIENLCHEKQVLHTYYGDSNEILKTSYKIPFDVKGEMDINDSFSKCFHANFCVTLLEGKIYPCTVAPNAHIFADKYECTNMCVGENDYINIYESDISEKKVLDFISTPIPFCRFCDVNHRTFNHEWSISNKEKKEWIVTERERNPFEERRIRDVREKLKFEVHLTEHCNLNCKGCYHFSSIAEEEYIDVEEYLSVIDRLSDIFDGTAERILLLGGEPLLHPEIIRIMTETRQKFPDGEIAIVTNGILLPQMGDDFWTCCSEYRIQLEPTKYPLNIDYAHVEEKAKTFNVEIHFFNMADAEKTLSKQTMDITGSQPKEDNFYGCYRANECITLKGNRLYTCIIPAHIHHFDKKFSLGLPSFESDGIDVFSNTKEEILDFLTRPIEACRYCDRLNIESGLPWEIGKGEIDEWVETK